MLTLILVVLTAAGCLRPQNQPDRDVRPVSDLLRDTYPDLASGRFAVIADFERSDQLELFHAVSVDQAAVPEIAPSSGVTATGAGCLRVTLRRSDDELVADNSRTGTWVLPRDWREFNLLLMNVHVSAAPTVLEVALQGGSGNLSTEAQSTVPLHAGWNAVRLDLAEAAEHVPLDEVHHIRWRLPSATGPIELKLDDLVLTNNQRSIFGPDDEDSADEGTLYVEQSGRRINVGDAGRFELGFANGQIVAWYNLSDDPARLTNLVGRDNAMGPMPVVLPEGDIDIYSAPGRMPPGFAALGDQVAARQRIIEANSVRVIAECVWEFGRSDSLLEQGDAPLRWRYTIYPTGEVYVSVDCVTQRGSFRPERLGLLVTRLPLEGIDAVTIDASEPQIGSPLLRGASFGSMAGGDAAGLLWVLSQARESYRLTAIRDPAAPRLSLLAVADDIQRPRHTANSVLSVWPRGNCSNPDRDALISSYTRHPDFAFQVGDADRRAAGDTDHDGFDESTGAFVLALADNHLQLRIDGRQRPLFNPVFSVPATAGRQTWVYVDYVIHEPVARDSAGDILFQLPGRIDRQVFVEVYLRDTVPSEPPTPGR